MRALGFSAVFLVMASAVPLAAAAVTGTQQGTVSPSAEQIATHDLLQPPAVQQYPLSPGIGAFGPEGPMSRAVPFTPAPTEKPRKQTPAKPVQRLSRGQILDDLFSRLARTSDSGEAKGIAGAIERVWMHSGSDTADLLMTRALAALYGDNYPLAESVLDAVVAIEPGWAEAWDQRATERYFAGNYRGAMQDISHVLAIEPRHFGALTEMGFILEKTGLHKSALRVFRRVLKIYPQQASIRQIVKDLTIEVYGRDI